MAQPARSYPPLVPEDLPAPSAVKCGNRRDLPKAQRRHDYRYAGICWRTNPNIPGRKFEAEIAICVVCGTEIRSYLGQVA